MKKIYPTFLMIIPLSVVALLLAFSSGPPAGYTGSPLDGQDCTSCHGPGPSTLVNDWITTNIPPEGYIPGTTYTITLTVIDVVAEKYGFQITSENTGAKAGTWVITDATRTQLTANVGVTHTTQGTVPVGNPNSWTMDWTAPESGAGTIGFYAAVNKTNNNNQGDGDEIYTASLMVNETGVGIAELEMSVGNIYPNPATDKISLDLPEDSKVTVFDILGKQIISQEIFADKLMLDVSGLENGIYYVRIESEGNITTRNFVKK
jgi:hypothetical protein